MSFTLCAERPLWMLLFASTHSSLSLMGPDRVLRRERLTGARGRFRLLWLALSAATVLRYEVAQAEPLPLRASIRDTRGSEELHLLGLLPVEAFLSSLKNLSMQKSFMEALPEDWALPRFSPSSAAELSELQTWLSKVKQQLDIDFDTLRNTVDPLIAASVNGKPSLMQELLNAVLEPSSGAASAPAGANLLLSGAELRNTLPSVLKEFTASLPLQSFQTSEDVLRRGSGLDETFLHKVQLFQRLPSLDQLDIGKLSEIFAHPSDIEWPVKRKKLALLLPIVTSAEDGGLLTSPYTKLLQGNGLTGMATETGKMLLPLAQPDGKLLFAKLKDIFPDMALPQTLTLLPLATLKNTELSTMDALWSGLKSTLLPRQAIMSADNASTLTGPVLNLANLAKLSLVSSESLRKRFLTHLLPGSEAKGNSDSTAANAEDDSGNKELLHAFAEALESGFPLEDTAKNVFTDLSTKLQQALLPFEGLSALDGTLPAPRFKSLDEWKGAWDQISAADFRDDLFFRLQLPVVAISRDSVRNTFRQLQRLPAACDGSSGRGTCPLGSSVAPPATQEELERSVVMLSSRVEFLAEQLKGLLHQLQMKVSELVSSRNATVGSDENRASAGEHTLLLGRGDADDQRESFFTPPSSPNDVKEPEGWSDGGRLLDLPNTFSHNDGLSKNHTTTLQEALDASVKLCDTLSVALRYTKNEVKFMQLLRGHAGTSGRNADQGARPSGHVPTYSNGYQNWELPDLASHYDPFVSVVDGNDSRRLPFLANIDGRALAALPRSIINGVVPEAEDENLVDYGRMKDTNRRLQATEEDGAPATQELVLLEPLALGKLLFANVDGSGLLEGLRKGIADATKPHHRLDGTHKDAQEATPGISFPPLLEELFASNALSFPAFTLPGAELLRAGVFPKSLLQAPVGKWVSPVIQLPTEAGKYAVPDLLQLHSICSQLKNLSLKDLLSGSSTAAIDALHINSDVLQHKLGDLHLKSLIPPQVAELPLFELVDIPEKGVFQLTELPVGSRALSLEKLFALDDATSALLTQPFGDVLGLKDVLEGLTFEQFRLPPAFSQGEVSDDNLGHLIKSLQHAVVAEKLPKLSKNPLAPLGMGDKGEEISADRNLLDFPIRKWLAPGSPSEAEDMIPDEDSLRKQKLAESSFLSGKKLPKGTQNIEPLSLANIAEGLRSHRPMADSFRHLWNTAGATFANELYF